MSLLSSVERIINQDINPALAEHTGHVNLISVEDLRNVILINLSYNSTCSSCGSVNSTTQIIEDYLNEELDEVLKQGKRIHVKITYDNSSKQINRLKELLMD